MNIKIIVLAISFAFFVGAQPALAQFNSLLKGLEEAANNIDKGFKEVASELEGKPDNNSVRINEATLRGDDSACDVALAANRLNSISVQGIFIGMEFECAYRRANLDEVRLAKLDKERDWEKSITCEDGLTDWTSYRIFPHECTAGVYRTEKVGYAGTISEGSHLGVKADATTGAVQSINYTLHKKVGDSSECAKFNADHLSSIVSDLGDPTSVFSGQGFTVLNFVTLRHVVENHPSNISREWNAEKKKWTAKVYSGCQELGNAVVAISNVDLEAKELEPPKSLSVAAMNAEIDIVVNGGDALGCPIVAAHEWDNLVVRGFRFGTNFECAMPTCKTEEYASASMPAGSILENSRPITTERELSAWTSYQMFPGSLSCGYRNAKIDNIGGYGGYDHYLDLLNLELERISGAISGVTYSYKQPATDRKSCEIVINELESALLSLFGNAPDVRNSSTSMNGDWVKMKELIWSGSGNTVAKLETACGDKPAPFVHVILRVE